MNAPTPSELAERFTASAGAKDRFGSTAEAVLEIAQLVAAASATWEKGSITAFQKDHDIHQKVWGKLAAIARSKNLRSIPIEDLPASYTALYALVVMKDEEFHAAMSEELLKSKNLSTRSILDWTKSFRMRGTGIEQEIPLTLVLMEVMTDAQFQSLLKHLRQVAEEHHAELLEGKGGIRQSEVKADQRRARALQIRQELRFAVSEDILDAPEDLKAKFAVESPDDLIDGSLSRFTGFFQLLEGKIPWMFWRKYGRLYCLKVAHEFNISDSRAERYQLKKRIRSAIENCAKEVPDFRFVAEEILATYMS